MTPHRAKAKAGHTLSSATYGTSENSDHLNTVLKPFIFKALNKH